MDVEAPCLALLLYHDVLANEDSGGHSGELGLLRLAGRVKSVRQRPTSKVSRPVAMCVCTFGE